MSITQPSLALAATLLIGLFPAVCAVASDLRVTHGRIEPVEKIGADVPLYLRVVNNGKDADALTRVRCPVSNFSEKYTVDRGEGAPARRAITSIPIAAGETSELEPPLNRHVMLLQIRQPLEEGSSFTCSITFKLAGTISTEIKVAKSP